MEKAEFEPRVVRARERLSQLEAESRVEEERQSAEQELRLVIGQLEAFARRVKEGLGEADWRTRREVIRALVKRVEIDESEVRVVYKVRPCPFVEGPEQGHFQDRVRRSAARSSRRAARATGSATPGVVARPAEGRARSKRSRSPSTPSRPASSLGIGCRPLHPPRVAQSRRRSQPKAGKRGSGSMRRAASGMRCLPITTPPITSMPISPPQASPLRREAPYSARLTDTGR